ncbi:hypothetical protein IFM89_028381 [Coptis chinensis]|uniref:KIB1-4 beta-propeller domain-containing protein n=1 Tax=Coptis chinensis TaxID=261450 RepID=A0A835LIW5_9MAGN|nr:hypothetical protein IFM89_028381 [Coptis chinensis]
MNNFSGWSELLCDLAHEIQERLALDDLIRFSSVCSFWNSLSGSFLRHKGRLPWLIVPYYVDPNVGRDPNYCSDGILGFFSILDGLTYKLEIPELVGRRICGTAFGWFITVHGNSEMQLLHPFTRKVVQLPALTEFPYSVGTRFSEEEGFLYQLQESLDDTENISEVNSDYMRDFHIYKAVTSPGLTNSSQPTVVIAIPMVYRQLYFCRPGKDSKWKRVIGKTAYYSDVTLYKGDFYAVRHTGEVDVVKNLDDADDYLGVVM